MQNVLRKARSLLFMLSRIWNKRPGPRDVVWLARFRSLTVYVILKGLLLITIGVIGTRIDATIPPGAFDSSLLFWSGTLLSAAATIVLLILGLTVASRHQHTRSLGVVMLCVADACVLLVVMYACTFGNIWLLLFTLVVISCTTPLFVERISRYANSYQQSKRELQRIQQTLDALLYQYSLELSHAIESERLAFRQKIHDGLLQELSTAQLQVGIMLMRNSRNGTIQLSADEFSALEVSLHRVIDDARALMQDGKTPQLTIEK